MQKSIMPKVKVTEPRYYDNFSQDFTNKVPSISQRDQKLPAELENNCTNHVVTTWEELFSFTSQRMSSGSRETHHHLSMSAMSGVAGSDHKDPGWTTRDNNTIWTKILFPITMACPLLLIISH